MKKALIISYNFPPVGGAGVQRPVKFVKYLREFGWEPLVLSVENPSVPVIDESLLEDIPVGVRVYRAKTLEPSYSAKSRLSGSGTGLMPTAGKFMKKVASRLLLPDLQILWWPGLVLKLLKILLKEKPDVVFVSAPPFSSFIPVVSVALLFRVPAVLDYRDEWSFSRENWENSIKNNFARWLDKKLENYALKNCAAFTAANQSYIDSLCGEYGNGNRQKGRVITNGYDQDDMTGLCGATTGGKIIDFIYTGTVWKATSLGSFMAAVGMLVDNDKTGEMAGRISINIFGRIVEQEMGYMEDHKSAGLIHLHGYTEHKNILREIIKSDVLLLTLSDLPGSGKIITGKVFEYMATGKHILAILPDGETKNLLLQNYDNLTTADPNDPRQICSALRNIIMSIDEIRRRRGNDVSHFSRKNLTHQLATLFDHITGKTAEHGTGQPPAAL